jgi:hypothetical protein
MSTDDLTPNFEAADRLDTSKAHSARRYDYWLGGKDNYAADRESGDEIEKRWPDIRTAVMANRAFLKRAVRYATERRGIRQFLDIGTGLPTADNTHNVAQSVDPTCRIVYVDNDPLVLVHARALLTSDPAGMTAYIDADLRNPQRILADRALNEILDLTQPVALMLVAILHFLPDSEDPYAIVKTLKHALAPGSLIVLSHGSFDMVPAAAKRAITTDAYPGQGDFHARTYGQVQRFFDGFELIEPDPKNPGHDIANPVLKMVSDWGVSPDENPPPPEKISTWGGVACKPSAGRR